MSTSAPAGPLGPIEIGLRADVRASAETIWEILVDWEHQDQWMLEASKLRMLTAEREGVGVEVEARVRIGGITTTDRVRVTRWEPPFVLGIEHRGRVKGQAVIGCVPTDAGCRVEWIEELEPPFGAVGGVGIRLFKPLMTRVFMRDLAVLKRLAEERAGTRALRPPADHTGITGARSAAAGESRPVGRRRTRGPEGPSLFARWFWLVYLPLGLFAAVLLLTLAGLVPGTLRVALLVLAGAWSALALRLLFERRRRRVAVPAPRSILIGIGAVAALGLGGGLLAWIGIDRVSTSEGLAMLLVGCFLMLMAVFAPMFKLVDSGFRLAARLISRRSQR